MKTVRKKILPKKPRKYFSIFGVFSAARSYLETLWYEQPMVIVAAIFFMVSLATLTGILLWGDNKVEASWFNDNWAYRDSLTITNTGSARTNYNPELTIDTDALISAGKLQSDCDDLRFTDIGGAVLNYWIRPTTCNTTTTDVWLRVPNLPISGVVIYMYYGNALAGAGSAVSPSNVFVREVPNVTAIWGMEEGTWTNNCSTNTLLDASGNGNHAKSCNNGIGPTTGTLAQYGLAGDFTGTAGTSVGFQFSNVLTDINTWSVGFWAKPSTLSQEAVMFMSYQANMEIVQEDGFGAAGAKITSIVGGVRSTSTYTFPNTTTYHYIVVTRSSTDNIIRFYVDGVSQGTGTGTPSNLSSDGSIGYKTGGGNRSFSGVIDEVSVYNRQLTTAEITDMSANYTYATTDYPGKVLVANKAILGGGISIGSFGSEENSPAPIAFWRMDEGTGSTANDASYNNNPGGLNGGPTWADNLDCVNGRCLRFDGVDDEIAPANTDKYMAATGYTWEAWFNDTNIPTGTGVGRTHVLFSVLDGAGCEDSYIAFGSEFTQERELTFNSDNDGGCGNRDSSPVHYYPSGGYQSNRWYHVAGVRDYANSMVYLYLDGRLVDSKSMSGSAITRSLDVRIASWCCSTYFFEGFMDDVRVYPYARNADQVKSDYNARGSINGAAATLGASTSVATTSSSVPIAYWKMDEASWTNDCSTATVLDSSGNGYDGKSCPNSTGPTTPSAGKVNNAGNFDGTNDRVDISSSFQIPSLNGTLSAWVYPTNGSWYVVGSGTGGNDFNFINNLYGFFIGSDYRVTPAYEARQNTWTYITLTWDQKNGSILYYNGAIVGTYNVPPPAYNQTGMTIGSQVAGGGSFFGGQIDEMIVYNYARSVSQITEDMNRGRPASIAPASPIAYWKVDEASWTNDCSTGTLLDYSGNNYNAKSCPNGSGPTTSVAGLLENAAIFDGSDDKFDVPTSFQIPSGEGTVSLWAYPTNSSYAFLSSGTGGNDFNMFHDLYGFFIGGDYRAASFTPPNDRWIYITMTWDQTVGTKVYYNGSIVGSNGSPPPAYSQTGANIGVGSGGSYFGGKEDEIRVYDVALTQDEIITDMQKALTRTAAANLASYWNLDEQAGTVAHDIGTPQNNGNLGTTTALPTWKMAGSSTCKINGCLSFDGSDTVVSGTVSSINYSNTLSYSAWVKLGSTGTPSYYVFTNRAPAGDNYALIYGFNSNKYEFYAENYSGTNPRTELNTPVSDTNWHHIAWTYDGAVLRGYLDGKLDVSTPKSFYLNTASSTFNIGTSNGSANFLNGLVDEVKVYSTPLTALQVAMDYNNSSAVTFGGILGTQDNEGTGGNPPVGYWRMDENTGTAVNDFSGNVNLGTLTPGTGAWAPGKLGSSFNFDKLTSSVDAGSGAVLDALAAMTLEAWIFPIDMGESSVGIIMDKNLTGTAPNAGWLLKFAGTNALMFTMDGSTDLVKTTANNSVTLNAWNHVMVTWDGVITSAAGVHIYINGTEVATYQTSTAGAARVSDASSKFFIGNEAAGAGTFNGRIDEVKVFNYVRSMPQLQYDYNRGAPILWYKMDACQGTTLNNVAPSASGGNSGDDGVITPGSGPNSSVGTCGSGNSAHMWNDGTIGKRNSALGFDGTNDYVLLTSPSFSALQQGSIAFWMKVSANSEVFSLGDKDTSLQNEFNLGVDVSSGQYDISLDVISGGTDSPVVHWTSVNAQRPVANTWAHVVITSNGSTFHTYINGEESFINVTFGTNDGKWFGDILNVDNMVVGAVLRSNVVTNPTTGLLDDLRIYNYPLSATQVGQVYNNGAVFFGPATGSP